MGRPAFPVDRDPLRLNASLASGPGFTGSRTPHLSFFIRRRRGGLAARGIRHTRAVFGLLQNSRVDAAYVEKLLPRLPAGDSELYSHPSLDDARMNSSDGQPPRQRLTEDLGIRLIRYRDL